MKITDKNALKVLSQLHANKKISSKECSYFSGIALIVQQYGWGRCKEAIDMCQNLPDAASHENILRYLTNIPKY